MANYKGHFFQSVNWLRVIPSVLFLVSTLWARAQDIVLSDFEQSTYSWLPGGTWTVTGTAFGSGPAQGTLPNQTTVDGYLGHGLVNTYLNGDASMGTLTSPTFTIQRKYIRFLIGAGNRRNQTCMNLLINGQVVRSAVGMGDREHLDWLQWNVSGYLNQAGQIQIVDSTTNGWGHVNVDQIIETDTSLSSVIVATNHYLNLPIRSGATQHLVELLQEGLVVREMNVELADTATNFWAFMDLTPLQGSELVVRVDSQLATTNQLAQYFIRTNSIITTTPIYQETLRPIYHYTARRGWLQDPNGLVYYKGQYHMFYQHNPYGCYWDNMHWGHAVSSNLVYWTELPEAIYPTYLGEPWSGSSVVDWNNISGLGVGSLISFFTSAAGYSDEPRMCGPYNFAQSMAFSTDSAATFTSFSNNPVLPNVIGSNHDPKVFWYAPGNKWVMALYLAQNDYGFFTSTNLKSWVQTSTFTLTNATEVPDLYPMALDGNTNNIKWIFAGGYQTYYVGTFDGIRFTPQYGPFTINGGTSFGASQTFNEIPATDGRRIMMVLGETKYSGMPFNELMNLPVQLTLVSSNGAPSLYVNPVNEVALLRTSTNTWPAQSVPTGTNLMNGMVGEGFEVDLKFQPGSRSQVVFSFGGNSITYDNARGVVTGPGVTQNLTPVNGTVHLRMFYDRGTIEVFGNDGQLYMPVTITPVAGQGPLSLTVSRSSVQLVSLALYNLANLWPAGALAGSAQPAAQPSIRAVGQVANGISFQWSGTAPNDFLVQWAAHLGDAWQTIATVSGGDSSFIDTNADRLNGGTGFYRVVPQ